MNEKQTKQNNTEEKTFTIPFASGAIKENTTISTNTPSKPSKEKTINQAFKLHSQGNTLEAAKYYQQFINLGFKEHRVYSNYGVILKNLGKLAEAERCQRKAIELNPDFAIANYNLGFMLMTQGELDDAFSSFKRALNLQKNYDQAIDCLGQVLMKQGKHLEGIKKLREGNGSIIFDYSSNKINICP